MAKAKTASKGVENFQQWAHALVTTRDGSKVISVGAMSSHSDQRVCVWQAPEGTLLASQKLGTGAVSLRAMALSPDERCVAAGTKKLSLLSPEDLSVLQTIEAHPKGEITGVSFSPSGARVATVSDGRVEKADNSVAVFDVATGEELKRFKLVPGGAYVCFGADDETLYTLHRHPLVVRRFDLASGEVVAVEHTTTSSCAKLYVSPAGPTLLQPQCIEHPPSKPKGKPTFERSLRVTHLDPSALVERSSVVVQDYWDDIGADFALSPDATRIAMNRGKLQGKEGVFDLVIVTIATGEVRVLAKLPVECSGVFWSKSGAQVYAIDPEKGVLVAFDA
ncbi:MAG: hypothetical protein Q8Q09_06290 [Deltaproteobacteria bacterium]|nr:hypothetical protein [Deltaproteobacteria bacterium]